MCVYFVLTYFFETHPNPIVSHSVVEMESLSSSPPDHIGLRMLMQLTESHCGFG